MDADYSGVIKSHLAQIFNIDAAAISPSTRIQKDLNATSLDVVELSATLGSHYSCEIADDQVEEAETVADLVQVVKNIVENS